ncbi:LysM peptidoglycan-binding domain-containing protein [Prosthecobacter dejongeii]|uniref:LysM repeat protein n=1 Tax=Prosthecobacter dejongeii TaxID=48465 RepID=A0A7W7YJ17_9BACT|nr:LysM domain-containing protein [Prosthecobacter dejongeii]MBB5037064.1 LysM repeat protein [Prosthecobacter dejongeii]
MSKKKKDKLLLNLLEGERYKHRVAMVTDEGAFNQHEPNSNMARMFVVMLLIHVVVIGGIIIYDFMNGEEAPTTALAENYNKPAPASVLPGASVDLGLVTDKSLEEYSTYAWMSGDSIPSVAKKLEVSEEVLIKLNKLDEGRQIKINDVIRYPMRPVVKAVGISVAGANGEIAQPAAPTASLAEAQVPINLALPGESGFSFSPTIENELTPAPTVAPTAASGMQVQDSPPPAVSKEASGTPVIVELPQTSAPKIEEAPPAPPAPAPQPVVKKEVEKEVPKAIPVPRQPEPKPAPVVEKAPVKKIADAPPPAKKEPTKATAGSHIVQSGETLYRIASKHGISVKALQEANKNTRPEALKIGMKLVIPRK